MSAAVLWTRGALGKGTIPYLGTRLLGFQHTLSERWAEGPVVILSEN
jgi:hypothetical protein